LLLILLRHRCCRTEIVVVAAAMILSKRAALGAVLVRLAAWLRMVLPVAVARMEEGSTTFRVWMIFPCRRRDVVLVVLVVVVAARPTIVRASIRWPDPRVGTSGVDNNTGTDAPWLRFESPTRTTPASIRA